MERSWRDVALKSGGKLRGQKEAGGAKSERDKRKNVQETEK